MNWLQKLPHARRSPAGLEWQIWRRLPALCAAGTALPIGALVLLHVAMAPASAADTRWLLMLNYVVAGAVTFHWTALLTVAMGCMIVMVMKGPAYVADAYHLPQGDKSPDDESRR